MGSTRSFFIGWVKKGLRPGTNFSPSGGRQRGPKNFFTGILGPTFGGILTFFTHLLIHLVKRVPGGDLGFGGFTPQEKRAFQGFPFPG